MSKKLLIKTSEIVGTDFYLLLLSENTIQDLFKEISNSLGPLERLGYFVKKRIEPLLKSLDELKNSQGTLLELVDKTPKYKWPNFSSVTYEDFMPFSTEEEVKCYKFTAERVLSSRFTLTIQGPATLLDDEDFSPIKDIEKDLLINYTNLPRIKTTHKNYKPY